MFNQLSKHLGDAVARLRNTRISDDNISDALSDVRRALIAADVALPVVKAFVERVRNKALGQQLSKQLRPGDVFVKIVQDEITHILGDDSSPLNLNAQPPVVILLAGLQGAGKTTTAGKLAYRLINQDKKKVMLTSVDIHRPAAILQCKQLSEQVNASWFDSHEEMSPTHICEQALAEAKSTHQDVLIIDTAGRLAIDDTLMKELKQVVKTAQPTETLLVVDSMAGQDAAKTVKAFDQAIPLTGAILTKIDGDARGGAALSLRWLTEKPIKFLGVGEKIDALEVFHPDRLASRILGMGDIVTLVEESQQKIDQKDADKIKKRLKSGQFNYNDFLDQLKQMKKLGSMKQLLSKLPGGMGLPKGAASLMDDTQFQRMEVIIYSMTKRERRFPALLNGSRKRRIANGSGTTVQDVNKLNKQFMQMQKMLKKMKGGNQEKMLKRLQSMQGNMPGGGKLPPDLFE